MADLLNQFGAPLPPGFPESSGIPPIPGMPSVIIPQPFSLAAQDKTDLDKLRDEVMDKVKTWENALTTFFSEYDEYAQNWRVQPKELNSKKPRGLFNSKSGESHRATETLATLWMRMLTASDQYFESVSKGLDPMGQPLTESDLYAVEKVILTQQRFLHFKEKLLRSLRSLALFGTVIFEEPWVMRPNGDGSAYFEGTDFQHRSLISTGFDTTVYDLEMSDYMFTVDYPTIWRIRDWARNDPDNWDRSEVEKLTQDESYERNSASPFKKNTNVFNRIMNRRQRAGYTFSDKNIRELVNYHGKLDTDNSVIQRYWESQGRQDDPNTSDFTLGILDGESTVRFHMTQYKTWHSRFKAAHFKLFELEPLGYGVGKIGKKGQRTLDVTESRMNDILMFALYTMWKVGRFAGLKANQLNIKPWNLVELDDITQLEQIKPDLNVIAQALQMQGIIKEDFRTTSGATSNLQAVATKATATEATLTQTEAIRGGSVHAEIIAETMIREHIEQMHINNLDNLDAEIWVAITGEEKPRYYNKNNLPRNVGFEIRVTTDKNFRPERTQKILEGLQMCTSIRNVVPEGINAARPLFEEWFRTLDLNPRLLSRPVPVADQLLDSLRRAQRTGQAPALGAETEGEAAGAAVGSGAQVSTPMGMVPTSPAASSAVTESY